QPLGCLRLYRGHHSSREAFPENGIDRNGLRSRIYFWAGAWLFQRGAIRKARSGLGRRRVLRREFCAWLFYTRRKPAARFGAGRGAAKIRAMEAYARSP